MEKTKVRIKLKGQFYGKVGTIVKRVNQYSFGVKFDDIRGVHPFGHRSLEIVDANYTDMSIQNQVAISIKSKLEMQAESIKRHIAEADKYQTQFSDGFKFAMTIMLGNINDLLNGKQ